MEQVYVIWWQYADKSASGVLRAYVDKERAQEDLDLLDSDTTSGKQYAIEELPIYGDA